MFLHDFSDVPLFIGRCSNDFKKKSSSLFNKFKIHDILWNNTSYIVVYL